MFAPSTNLGTRFLPTRPIDFEYVKVLFTGRYLYEETGTRRSLIVQEDGKHTITVTRLSSGNSGVYCRAENRPTLLELARVCGCDFIVETDDGFAGLWDDADGPLRAV